MNKICTTLEQSKKLIELDLDVNTADMMWFDDGLGEPMEIVCSYNPTTSDDVPAWSLSALLGLMPLGSRLLKGSDISKYHFDYPNCGNTGWYDNPIDAAYEMVCWLLENKKI